MLSALMALVLVGVLIVPTFYGLWRAWRTEEWGWFWGIVGGWLIGFGWLVGLVFLFGTDRRYRAQVAAARRGDGYHPDYKRLAG